MSLIFENNHQSVKAGFDAGYPSAQ